MITSIRDAVLEMVFENVSEWRITEDQSDIIEAWVGFDDNGFVVWTDNAEDTDNFRENGSYAVAEKMKWRIVE